MNILKSVYWSFWDYNIYLHHKGDISGLKLKTPIGYDTVLDKNTLDVIHIDDAVSGIFLFLFNK